MTKPTARRSGMLLALSLAASLWLAACGGTPTAVLPTNDPGLTGPDTGYPPPTITAVPMANGYPAPTEAAPTPEGAVPFVLARPIVEGAVTVTGTGQPGVPIALQDVTFMGAPLATTVVDANGNFSFSVAPLERSHRLGVTLGDFTGTDFIPEQFLSQAYWGPGAQQLPQVNFYWDTEMVQPPQ